MPRINFRRCARDEEFSIISARRDIHARSIDDNSSRARPRFVLPGDASVELFTWFFLERGNFWEERLIYECGHVCEGFSGVLFLIKFVEDAACVYFVCQGIYEGCKKKY